MKTEKIGPPRPLADAFYHLKSAISLLDGARAPAQIAAHVDLAACQLLDILKAEGIAVDAHPDLPLPFNS